MRPDVVVDDPDANQEASAPIACGVRVPQTVRMARADADILMGVDGTSDMEALLPKIEAGLLHFGFELLDSDVDARFIIVSEGPPEDADNICLPPPVGNGDCVEDDSDPPRYVHVFDASVSGSVLGSIDQTSNYNDYEPFLRDTANMHLVVVSSDDGVGFFSADDRHQRVLDLDPRFRDYRFHAIVPQPGSDCGPSDEFYPSLVDRTGGITFDICDDDLTEGFDTLRDAVLSGADSCAWDIPPTLDGPQFEVGQVNVVVEDSVNAPSTVGQVPLRADCSRAMGGHGWYFDDPVAPTQMLACPTTCAALRDAGSTTLSVEFGCATLPADFIQ